MKLLYSLSLLVLLLGGCSTEDGKTDSSLGDLYDTGDGSEEVFEGDNEVDESEIPTSVGPTELPADLVPSR